MIDLYKELKEKDYYLYKKTIEKADVLGIQNDLSLEQRSNLEKTLVEFVLQIITK